MSAHYENFVMSRKVALTHFAGIAFFSVCMTITDLNWVARSALIPWTFWLAIHYWYLEGSSSFFKPLLQRFYRKIAANEIFYASLSFSEARELSIRDYLRITKE